MGKGFVIVWAAVAAMSSTVSAQTRTFSGEITAGTVGLVHIGEVAGQVDLAGLGFHIVGSIGVGRLEAVNCVVDPTCVSGAQVDLSASWAGFVSGFNIHNGRVTVNGETLEPANVAMRLVTLDAVPVTIPSGNRKNLVLSTPFVLTGLGSSLVLQVEVYHGDDSITAEPWAIGEISGDGIATGFFERIRYQPPVPPGVPGRRMDFYYELRDLIYSFNAP